MTMELPAKYETIKTRLMENIPSAKPEEIDAFLFYALGNVQSIRHLVESGFDKITAMLGFSGLAPHFVTSAMAENLLAILEAFGTRDWTNPADRQAVYEELASQTENPILAEFVRQYTKNANDKKPLPRAHQSAALFNNIHEIEIVRTKLQAIGYSSNKADAIIRYFQNGGTKNKPACVDNLKVALGIKGNFSMLRREVAWQILLTQPAATIINPEALSQFLTKCLNKPSDFKWLYPTHREIIKKMIFNLNHPAFKPMRPFITEPAPSAPSVNQISPKPTNATQPVIERPSTDNPSPQTIRIVAPLVTDDRSPWRRAFEDRLARAKAANANRPAKEITPVSNHEEIFLDRFGFRHIADYTQQILQCANLILNQTIGDDPMDCILMAIMIMAKPEHDTIYLRKYLPYVLANTPNGNEYFTTRQNDIAEAILIDGFAININHAKRWCASNKVEWRDFMAGAMMAAHGAIAKHITATNIDLSNHPGFKWPERARHAPTISDAFQRYTADKVAQALMGTQGWAKVKTDTPPAPNTGAPLSPAVTLAAVKTRGSM